MIDTKFTKIAYNMIQNDTMCRYIPHQNKEIIVKDITCDGIYVFEDGFCYEAIRGKTRKVEKFDDLLNLVDYYDIVNQRELKINSLLDDDF